MVYELTGRVKKVCDTETFASGFKKRSLIVLEQNDKTKYPQTWAVDYTKERIDLLNSIRAGDTVSCRFSIAGREWTDPKTGKVRYFTTLNGIDVKSDGSASSAPAPAVPPSGAGGFADDDPMPF